MEFVCFTEWSQLPESAQALFDTGSNNSVFFSRPWLENLANTVLVDDQSMLLACVIEGDEVLALLPLMKQQSEHWDGLTHLYSSLFSLLLVQKNQQAVLNCLVQGFSQLPFVSLQLGPIAEDDSVLLKLQQTMQSFGYECHRYFRFYNWVYKVQGQSFKDYFASRPGKVRNTITRKQRKLSREFGYDIRLFIDQDIKQGVDDYNAVYKSSWKANEQYDHFVEGLASQLSEQSWLRLAVLYVDGKPIAAQFWFVVHAKASIFKLAYDEAWKKYSPGSILISYLMEYVIDTDKVEEIDFLTGNDAYKKDFMNERRKRERLACIKPKQRAGVVNNFVMQLKRLINV
ncbi:MAG: GNAT family N-acetyltransferase [Gammaproteobacteria bacterium]|nr:GNAT family N-acetyltransferase [Gammaproteobacteria bacterium]